MRDKVLVRVRESSVCAGRLSAGDFSSDHGLDDRGLVLWPAGFVFVQVTTIL